MKFFSKLFLGTVVTAILMSLMVPVQGQSPANFTTFKCEKDSKTNFFATIANRGENQAIFLLWTEPGPYFGDPYTPQNRCNIVTSKLNTVVRANEGSLQNLVLTNGTVNNAPVICVLKAGENACNANNVLFTLNPENANKADFVLNQLVQFGQGNVGGNTIVLSSNNSVVVKLSDWETQVFGNLEQPATVPGGF